MHLSHNCKRCQYNFIQAVAKLKLTPINKTAPVDTSIIIDVVSEICGVYKSQLQSKCRLRRVADARFIAVKLIKEEHPGDKLKTIGELFGTDHSCVIYYLKRFDELSLVDRSFRKNYEAIKIKLKGHLYA
jgi:chromosomal replication initiation ATPase DnaA